MAYRSLAFNNEIIWRAPLPSAERELANAIRDKITALRPHLLDFIRLNEEAPHHALTTAEWSQPATLSSLIATYSDHIYRNQPGQAREQKPLLSLWAQWYIGLLVPPLMLSLLSEERAVSLAPEHFRVEFHETGRAACFWIDIHSAGTSPAESAQSRMEKLVTTALQPVVQALEATGDINGKLIWSNTGYLINWYLGEMRTWSEMKKWPRCVSSSSSTNSYQAVRITRCGVRWFYVKGSSCAAPAASAIACRTYSSAGTVR